MKALLLKALRGRLACSPGTGKIKPMFTEVKSSIPNIKE